MATAIAFVRVIFTDPMRLVRMFGSLAFRVFAFLFPLRNPIRAQFTFACLFAVLAMLVVYLSIVAADSLGVFNPR